jgi:squalene-hopene/tetraprenyl-beta-curcumene cyclase
MGAMFQPLRLARLALLLFGTALALAAPTRAQDASKISDEIDPALHWLRTKMELATGSYGGVEPTALVLRAFAQSPRQYVPGDGPFIARAVAFLQGKQRADGSIADPTTPQERLADTTALAVAALTALPEGSAADTLKRALAYLSPRMNDVTIHPAADPTDAAAARKLAGEWLARRRPDGSWDGPNGAVVATAEAVLALNSSWRVLLKDARPSAPKATEPLPVFSPADRARSIAAMERGARFLLTQMIADQPGRFGRDGKADAGVTAMALAGLARLPAPRPPDVDKALGAGLDWLTELYRSGKLREGGMANYVTSALVMAVAAAGRPQDRALVGEAQAFLKSLQSDEGSGYSEGDRYYGGIGYGGDERPDLSNLSMALEALAASDLDQKDPAFQKALVFLQRCQNRSESNDVSIREGQATIKSGNDGGAGYAPGESKAGFITLADGTKVPRSYGSMTYALLRCYLFAGLTKDDPRVQAAWKWLCENYTLDVNPGFEGGGDPAAPYQGLYYYFHSMGRALQLYGSETLIDRAGKEHAWRAELAGRMTAMQRQDGSWKNDNSPRWWEGNPVLATSYALLTLAYALPR